MVIFAVKLLKMLLKLLSIHLLWGERSIHCCFHGFGCSLTSSEKLSLQSHHWSCLVFPDIGPPHRAKYNSKLCVKGEECCVLLVASVGAGWWQAWKKFLLLARGTCIYSRNISDSICASKHAENIIHTGHLLEEGTNSGNMSGLIFPCPSDPCTDCLANQQPVGQPSGQDAFFCLAWSCPRMLTKLLLGCSVLCWAWD